MDHSAADWLDKSKHSQTGLSSFSEPGRKLCVWKKQSPKPQKQWGNSTGDSGRSRLGHRSPSHQEGQTHRHNVSELLRLSSLLQPLDSDRKDEPRVDRNLLFPTVVTVPYIWFNCLLLSFNCYYFLILIVMFKTCIHQKVLMSILSLSLKIWPYLFSGALYIIPLLYTFHLILTLPHFSHRQFTLPVHCW